MSDTPTDYKYGNTYWYLSCKSTNKKLVPTFVCIPACPWLPQCSFVRRCHKSVRWMQKRAELMKELIMCGRPQGSNLGSPLLICMQCLRAACEGPLNGIPELGRCTMSGIRLADLLSCNYFIRWSGTTNFGLTAFNWIKWLDKLVCRKGTLNNY